jgi:hypothetical protein
MGNHTQTFEVASYDWKNQTAQKTGGKYAQIDDKQIDILFLEVKPPS